MVWDDAKREATRQRMAKARSMRKPKGVSIRLDEIAPSNEPFTTVIEKPDLMLTVRRLHVGSFSGLWELCRINSDGSKTVVTDANTKSIIMSLARNEIMKCGQ